MATTYQESVEQTIIAGEQLHQIINGDANTEITVEDGSKVPSVRKALVDNFYFKDPLDWQVGQTESVFNQLRKFTDGTLWYARSATANSPVNMGATPVGDPLWVIFSEDAIAKLTPQIREALRRSYAESGYNLVTGSFEEGGTIVNPNDVLLHESSGKAYSGDVGVVPPETDPILGGFVDVSSVLLSDSFVSVFKYLTIGEISDIVSGSATINVNAKCQTAVTLNKDLYFPAGVYLLHRIAIPAGHRIHCAGSATVFKRDYYPGAMETALVILSNDSKLHHVVIDGNKAAAPAAWGTGTYAVGVEGFEVIDVEYKNCRRDGLYIKDSSNFKLGRINTETNDRVGVGIVGNCKGFNATQLRHKNDTVAGLDLEPDTDSTENSGFAISDVIVDGTLLSVQGASSSLVNKNGSLTNLVAINGGVIRFNKFDDLAVSGVSCDSTSELRLEDSYPTIFGRGVGDFTGVRVTLLAPDAVNQVPEPYFTSVPSLSWSALTSGAGSSISHVLVQDWGKYVAQISVTSGSAGNFASYVSPAITVSGNEWVSMGGSLKALVGRPFIEIQYRAGTTVLDTYRAAGGQSADGIWRKFMKYTKTPPTCDNVRFIIGGAFDTVGDFSGDFDGFYVYRNCFKHDAGPINTNLIATKAYDPPDLADGVGITTTVSCQGALLGDTVTAAFSVDLQGVMLSAWVSAANVVSVRFQNESGASVNLANGVLKVRVNK